MCVLLALFFFALDSAFSGIVQFLLDFVGAARTYAVGFGAFFASIVIIPLWLQTNMGYTAAWAGYATGIMGILAVLTSPLVGKAVEKFDPRAIVCMGILALAGIMLCRMWTSTPDLPSCRWPATATMRHVDPPSCGGLDNLSHLERQPPA